MVYSYSFLLIHGLIILFGSRHMAHGSRLMAHDSWLMAQDSWLMAHGSWPIKKLEPPRFFFGGVLTISPIGLFRPLACGGE